MAGPRFSVAHRQSAEARALHLSRMGTLGLALAIVIGAPALVIARTRFSHGLFVSFGFLVTLALGALFLTLIHYLLRPRWSFASIRRLRPVVRLLPWCMLVHMPAQLLEPGFADTNSPWKIGFFARTLCYWMIWISLSFVYGNSKLDALDAPTAPWYVRNAERASGPSLAVFAITTTFASFDWFMNFQHGWHSAVFGVYVFAGAVASALSMLAVVTLVLEQGYLVDRLPNTSVRHDVGKLLFAFVTFWAYIAFSQYLLIWYAGLAAETPFYNLRFGPEWQSLTGLLFALHFVVPFLGLLSATTKRSRGWLGGMAVMVLLAHGLDYVWLVMPALESRGARPSFVDVSAALVVVSTLTLMVSRAIVGELQSHNTEPLAPEPEPIATGFKLAG